MAKVVHLDKQLQNHITFIVNRGEENEHVYDSLEDFSNIEWRYKGLYRISSGNKYGLINSAGYEVISPKYDDLRPFRRVRGAGFDATYFIAKLGNLRGILDYQGKIIVPYKYRHKSYC